MKKPKAGDILWWPHNGPNSTSIKIMLPSGQALTFSLKQGFILPPALDTDEDGPLGGHIIVGHIPELSGPNWNPDGTHKTLEAYLHHDKYT